VQQPDGPVQMSLLGMWRALRYGLELRPVEFSHTVCLSKARRPCAGLRPTETRRRLVSVRRAARHLARRSRMMTPATIPRYPTAIPAHSMTAADVPLQLIQHPAEPDTQASRINLGVLAPNPIGHGEPPKLSLFTHHVIRGEPIA
jgi:hypothetical protein